jgi:hypothetical protein
MSIDSTPESGRSKKARYQLSHQSLYLATHPLLSHSSPYLATHLHTLATYLNVNIAETKQDF